MPLSQPRALERMRQKTVVNTCSKRNVFHKDCKWGCWKSNIQNSTLRISQAIPGTESVDIICKHMHPEGLSNSTNHMIITLFPHLEAVVKVKMSFVLMPAYVATYALHPCSQTLLFPSRPNTVFRDPCLKIRFEPLCHLPSLPHAPGIPSTAGGQPSYHIHLP